jgi:hypothetical protein
MTTHDHQIFIPPMLAPMISRSELKQWLFLHSELQVFGFLDNEKHGISTKDSPTYWVIMSKVTTGSVKVTFSSTNSRSHNPKKGH